MNHKGRYIVHIATTLLCSVVLLLCSGCRISYKFNGSALDYNLYKNISISDFPIRAALVYPPLQQTFENKLHDMITRQTRLRVVDNTSSDLRIEGEITGYALSPQAVTEDAYASQTRLTITVRVKYINNKEEGQDLDQSFSSYKDFSSSELLSDVQDELCNQICDELCDLIFNATLGNW